MEDEWLFWRPIVGGALTHTEASQMYDDELAVANLALDKWLEVNE